MVPAAAPLGDAAEPAAQAYRTDARMEGAEENDALAASHPRTQAAVYSFYMGAHRDVHGKLVKTSAN